MNDRDRPACEVDLVDQILLAARSAPGADEAHLVDLRVGAFWTVVSTSVGAGMASTMVREACHHSGDFPVRSAGLLRERSPVELSELLRSSSSAEAAVGLAATNALLGRPRGAVADSNAREILCERAAGRLLAMVGHFPFVSMLREVCREMWVFEREHTLQPGDLPSAAMKELLPHADVVAVTGTTLINSTLETVVPLVRKDAFMMMLGPSTPLTPCLLEHGFDVLCGTVIENPDSVLRAVEQGAVTQQITGVRRLSLWADC